MSKAQTDEIAALRIELDATKATDGVKRERDEAIRAHEETKAQMARYTTALRKIDGIRNSIVGMQGFNFSEHAYPLVAALGEAGFEGDGYVLSAKNLGTLIEQRNAAERERDEARTQSADLAKQLEEMRAINLGQVKSFRAQRDALTKQVKALAEERDGYKETAARIWSLREYALEHNGPSEMECGHPDNLLDRSVESGTVFCAGCRNAEMLRDALHMEQTHKAERDSLRERLGDAERVIATLGSSLSDASSPAASARFAARDRAHVALAEFDAKWGKR